MYAIAQTSDGFLWFPVLLAAYTDSTGSSSFLGFRLPVGSIRIENIFGDHAGGLWALGEDGIAHVKNGAVISDVQLARYRRARRHKSGH